MLPKWLVEPEQAASARAQATAAPRRAPNENVVKWRKSPIPSPIEPAVPQRRRATAPERIRRSRPLPYVGLKNAVSGASGAGYRDVVNARYFSERAIPSQAGPGVALACGSAAPQQIGFVW